MKNLTAIYWIKNETPYLPEWIEFHLLQGFDHFILYDNDSNDGLEDSMTPYIRDGILEIRKYPEEVKNSSYSKNYWVMSHCIDEQKNKSKWIHFHAIDEFTYCPSGILVTELLKEFDNFGGLAVNWKLFGINGHIKKPKGLVIENYTTRLHHDAALHVKTIIQPLKTRSPAPNTHWFYTDKTVDENYNPVHGPFNVHAENLPPISPPPCVIDFPKSYTYNKIANNHYVTRSQEEFESKNNKGLLDHGKISENSPRNYQGYPFNENVMGGWVEDLDILKYVDIVKNNIKKRK